MNFPAAKAAVPAEGFLPNPKGRLKDQFHEVARFKHLSPRSEESYWGWMVWFLKFHRISGQWRHPRDLGKICGLDYLGLRSSDSLQPRLSYSGLLALRRGQAIRDGKWQMADGRGQELESPARMTMSRNGKTVKRSTSPRPSPHFAPLTPQNAEREK